MAHSKIELISDLTSVHSLTTIIIYLTEKSVLSHNIQVHSIWLQITTKQGKTASFPLIVTQHAADTKHGKLTWHNVNLLYFQPLNVRQISKQMYFTYIQTKSWEYYHGAHNASDPYSHNKCTPISIWCMPCVLGQLHSKLLLYIVSQRMRCKWSATVHFSADHGATISSTGHPHSLRPLVHITNGV